MAILRIDNALIMTMADGATVERGWTFEAVDGVITFVGPSTDFQPSGEPDEVIDASGMLLLPGFVNAHTHAAMTLFRGAADDMPLEPWLQEKIWPVEARLTEQDVYWGTMLGIVEMLRAGVTCFNDMYHLPEMGTRAAEEAGIRMCPSGVLLGILPNAGDMLAQAAEFCREYPRSPDRLIAPMLAPHAPYTCPREMLERVIATAADCNVPLHIHLAETQADVQWSLEHYGKRTVQAMQEIGLFAVPVLAAHCVHLDETDISVLAENQVGVAHCPGSNMKLASGMAPVRDLLAAGAIVGLGTDGCGSNNNLDLLEEARLAALLAKVRDLDPTAVPAATALHMATLGGAQALFLGEVIGSLQPGKRADCILIDLDQPHLQPLHEVDSQLIYAARASDVHTTIVDGQVLLRAGQFTRLDEAEIIARATECARRLFG